MIGIFVEKSFSLYYHIHNFAVHDYGWHLSGMIILWSLVLPNELMEYAISVVKRFAKFLYFT
jgi:hypothetical protein